jgi:hypothetical protein
METVRLCLKHFRQKNMMDVYQLLKNKSGVELEHPLITKLHQSLVIQADFEKTEEIIKDAENRNIFNSYVKDAIYTTNWQKLVVFNDGTKYRKRGKGQNINRNDDRR